MVIRNRRDDAWIFHSDLTRIFLFCRNIPLQKKNGSKISFGDIFRIERHSFKVNFEPVETKIAYRVICGRDVQLRPRKTDGSDMILNDDAPDGSEGNEDGSIAGQSPGLDANQVNPPEDLLLCDENLDNIGAPSAAEDSVDLTGDDANDRVASDLVADMEN